MKIGAAGSNPVQQRPITADGNEIKLLEKQKAMLQEKIQKVNDSKEDLKTKQQKIKEIQSQIDEIDAAIQQKRNEKLNQVNGEQGDNGVDQNKSQKKDMLDGTLSNADGDALVKSNLMQATTTYDQVKTMMHVKRELVHRGSILKLEIAFDERSGGTATMKRAELSKVNKQEGKIEKKAASTLQKAQEQVDSASEDQEKEVEKKRKKESAEELKVGQAPFMKENF